MCVALLCLGCTNVPLWFKMLRYVVFPTVSDIKISATHFAKVVAVVTWLRDKKLNSSIQLLLNLHKYFFSSPEHHLTLLLPFLPLTVDSTSRVYYLRRNLQRNWVVGYQVEVTNGFVYCEFVYCVDCVRWCIGWCVSYKTWQLYNLGIKYWCDYSYN